MVISLIATSVKRLGAVCLALVILWHLAHHAGPQVGKAIVHAPRPGVLVSIDNRSYRIDSLAESPVVCELSPGAHTVKVHRDELLLGEEDFTVEPGKQVILHPIAHWAATRVAVSSERESVPASTSARPAGLAIRIRKPAAINH
jgi:hypothetical protein